MIAREEVLTVCDGIGAVHEAWRELDWRFVLSSEIDAFPRSVLEQRQGAVDARLVGAAGRGVPLWGDFTAIRMRHLRRLGVTLPSLLAGGTPCQAFSVAGLRESLGDARGNLTLQFVKLANAIDAVRVRAGLKPLVIVWENVPGVLSVKDNAFGCFLAGVVGADAPLIPGRGQKWTDSGLVVGPRRAAAWTVCDAQYFGLAQRRRRVFVISSAREGFDPAAVLFEPEGVFRDSPPRREAGESAAAGPPGSIGAGCYEVSPTLQAGGHGTNPLDEPLVAHAFDARQSDVIQYGDLTGPLDTDGHTVGVLAFSSKDHGQDAGVEIAPTLRAMPGEHANAGGQVAVAYGIRSDASRAGEAKTPSPDAEGRVRLRDPGLGITEELSPTLDAARPHTVAFALRGREDGAVPEIHGDGDTVGTLRAAEGGSSRDYVAFHSATEFLPQSSRVYSEAEASPTLQASGKRDGNRAPQIATASAVRRLMPVECERLQGFWDGYTAIVWKGRPAAECPDGPRYKALGNSMAIPVVAWIGQQIQAEEERRLSALESANG